MNMMIAKSNQPSTPVPEITYGLRWGWKQSTDGRAIFKLWTLVLSQLHTPTHERLFYRPALMLISMRFC